ncbi:MAG: signal recognition particle subunit SRP19/SEC65 family protein [Candidatus Odinarchaeia archaeon]
MRNKNKIIIWPEYFDYKLSRNQGRRIPKNIAIESPQLSEVAKAASILKLKFEVEKDAAYPRTWWNRSGRLLIDKDHYSKNELIKKIAYVIKRMRGKH